MYFNNLGVAHFHLRKHSLGVFYLHRAAEENMKALRDAHQQDGMSIFVFDSGFLEIFGFLKEKLGSWKCFHFMKCLTKCFTLMKTTE